MSRHRLTVLFALAALAPSSLAQNRDHPGLVYAEKLGWVTPEEALAKGYFEYERRFFPKSMASKLESWAKQDQKSSDWKDAYKTESKNYRIMTNVPRFIVETEVKPFLDEIYDVYTTVFKRDFGLSGKATNKKFIRIYHGYESYALYAGGSDGAPPRTTPGFIEGGSVLSVFYEDTEPAEFYGAVFHEGAHQFVGALLPGARLPHWLDEALATYFEGCTYSRATKKITVDHFPKDRIAHAVSILKNEPADDRGLAERLFMNVTADGFEAGHYALAWSFVYYVTHTEDGKYRDKFAKFLRATNGAGAKPISEVFEESTRLDLADIQKGWRDFVLSLAPPPLPKRVILEVTGTDPAADVKSGDIVWSVGGVEVFEPKTLDDALANRPKDEPLSFVLVRRVPAAKPVEYVETFVTATVPPGSPIRIVAGATLSRDGNLRD